MQCEFVSLGAAAQNPMPVCGPLLSITLSIELYSVYANPLAAARESGVTMRWINPHSCLTTLDPLSYFFT